MLHENQINANYAIWVEKLHKYNCFSQQLLDDLGSQIAHAPFAMETPSGAAYNGALLDVVLNHLCIIAFHLNEWGMTASSTQQIVHPYLKVNTNMLLRVLLLQHISKAELFVSQQESWKLKKGMLYQFNNDITTTLRTGERSLFLCQKYGITLTEDEFDAMRIIDKLDELSANAYISPLAQMVKTVNQFAALEMRRLYETANVQKNKQQTIEK